MSNFNTDYTSWVTFPSLHQSNPKVLIFARYTSLQLATISLLALGSVSHGACGPRFCPGRGLQSSWGGVSLRSCWRSPGPGPTGAEREHGRTGDGVQRWDGLNWKCCPWQVHGETRTAKWLHSHTFHINRIYSIYSNMIACIQSHESVRRNTETQAVNRYLKLSSHSILLTLLDASCE